MFCAFRRRCDIILELAESGELKEAVAAGAAAEDASVDGRIRKLLKASDVLLFMKGTRDTPRCGFSRKVVEARPFDRRPRGREPSRRLGTTLTCHSADVAMR